MINKEDEKYKLETTVVVKELANKVWRANYKKIALSNIQHFDAQMHSFMYRATD